MTANSAKKPKIYANDFVARMLAAKMTKAFGVNHKIEKVQTGWRIASDVEVEPAAPALMDALKAAKAAGVNHKVSVVSAGIVHPVDAVSVVLTQARETPLYVVAKATPETPDMWMEKAKLYAWEFNADTTVTVVMPHKQAKARKLI